MIRYIRRAAAFCLLLLVAPAGQRRPHPGLRGRRARRQPRQPPPARSPVTTSRAATSWSAGSPSPAPRTPASSSATNARTRNGPLYAPVTGYASQTYGTTLLENAEDGILSGTDPMLAPLPLWNEITRGQQPGGKVVTTINAAAAAGRVRRARRAAGRGRRARAVDRQDPGAGQQPLVRSGAALRHGFGGRPTAWPRLNAATEPADAQPGDPADVSAGLHLQDRDGGGRARRGRGHGPRRADRHPRPRTCCPAPRTTLPNEARGCEDASLADAIRVSCNTVMAKLGVQVGLDGMVAAAAEVRLQRHGAEDPVRGRAEQLRHRHERRPAGAVVDRAVRHDGDTPADGDGRGGRGERRRAQVRRIWWTGRPPRTATTVRQTGTRIVPPGDEPAYGDAAAAR